MFAKPLIAYVPQYRYQLHQDWQLHHHHRLVPCWLHRLEAPTLGEHHHHNPSIGYLQAVITGPRNYWIIRIYVAVTRLMSVGSAANRTPLCVLRTSLTDRTVVVTVNRPNGKTCKRIICIYI